MNRPLIVARCLAAAAAVLLLTCGIGTASAATFKIEAEAAAKNVDASTDDVAETTDWLQKTNRYLNGRFDPIVSGEQSSLSPSPMRADYVKYRGYYYRQLDHQGEALTRIRDRMAEAQRLLERNVSQRQTAAYQQLESAVRVADIEVGRFNRWALAADPPRALPPVPMAGPIFEIVHVDFPKKSTVGDVNSVIATIRNNESRGRRYNVVLSFTGVMRVRGSGTRSIYIGPKSSGRVSWTVDTVGEGDAEIAIDVDPIP